MKSNALEPFTKPDPALAQARFVTTNPRQWFAHPVVALAPMIITAWLWLTGGIGTSPVYYFFFSTAWLVAVFALRATSMTEAHNFVGLYPNYLAWFRGLHTLLIRRGNIESFTREPAREALFFNLWSFLTDEPTNQHFTLHLMTRGSLGYNYLGQTNPDLRKHISIEVTEPDAFEAALREWLAYSTPQAGVADTAWR